MSPTTDIGATLALADRLDSLVGIFSIGQQPSGSRDPFALRRASLGVLRIMLERNIDLNLTDLIAASSAQFNIGERAKISGNKLEKQVLTYIIERFKSWYKEKGIQTEVFLSVAALELSNPMDIDSRVAAVHKFTLLPEATALASANKRVSNILAKQLPEGNAQALDTSLLKDTAEIELANQILAMEEAVAPLLKQRDYNAILEKLAGLREAVDQFFEM